MCDFPPLIHTHTRSVYESKSAEATSAFEKALVFRKVFLGTLFVQPSKFDRQPTKDFQRRFLAFGSFLKTQFVPKKGQSWPLPPLWFLRESMSLRAPKVLDAFQRIRMAKHSES